MIFNPGLVKGFVRQLSTSPAKAVFHYEAPLKTAVANIKRFSVGSLGLTYMMTPLMLLLDANGIGFGTRLIMISTACAASTISTGLIHWAGKSYVTEGTLKENLVTFTTLNLLGRRKEWKYNVEELQTPDAATSRPFTNIETKKHPKKYFYVHQEIAKNIFEAIEKKEHDN
ncbi:hypothetical protein SPOG_01053 [Schizosaccharomyces cryophilus OY26]|uniref:Uncharacterized protein n=1 Tax=Schizosaccharomyces cryophilus (strain OY26 / ATCC MYA-4695 / CBS 11777 / NBRC 106824 / NRRL Y48691) TaxID=653667 RepID=S9X011_SCHCR|nr:uncharacterized protein SPOG_01053 [Schizosaccharomyces cryophilus OY26]EPY50292.1 hypothetical protein SPOG_01053 [Schizosaccharomyces cryophilus OY26]